MAFLEKLGVNAWCDWFCLEMVSVLSGGTVLSVSHCCIAELDYLKTLLSTLKDGKPLVLPSLMAAPSEYDGEDRLVGRVVMQCRIYLQYLTCPNPPELVKVLFMKTFLQGLALDWSELIFQHRAQEARTVEGFFQLLTACFAAKTPNLPSVATPLSATHPARGARDDADSPDPVSDARDDAARQGAAPGTRDDAAQPDPVPVSSMRDAAKCFPVPMPSGLPAAPLNTEDTIPDLVGLSRTEVADSLVLPGPLSATAVGQDLATVAAALLDPQPNSVPRVEDAALPAPVPGAEIVAPSAPAPRVEEATLPVLVPRARLSHVVAPRDSPVAPVAATGVPPKTFGTPSTTPCSKPMTMEAPPSASRTHMDFVFGPGVTSATPLPPEAAAPAPNTASLSASFVGYLGISIYNVALIAIDRYFAISNPFLYAEKVSNGQDTEQEQDPDETQEQTGQKWEANTGHDKEQARPKTQKLGETDADRTAQEPGTSVGTDKEPEQEE
ncbi:hypothetical protein P4O66_003673 [Electrophorus voltai]|uniref:DUF4939 domain-containing protein n=1 Tax=Electrophorus voltai TaxID=2609070 RepID=A0AAD8ZTA0_9TELE|nr:hypothetical protein P4O66_003673 [Electrophorus voltai]